MIGGERLEERRISLSGPAFVRNTSDQVSISNGILQTFCKQRLYVDPLVIQSFRTS